MPTLANPQVFIVRVWRRFGAFRASVRRVDEAQGREFCAPGELASYLADTGDAPGAAAPGVAATVTATTSATTSVTATAADPASVPGGGAQGEADATA
jgi:hypothetical protein